MTEVKEGEWQVSRVLFKYWQRTPPFVRYIWVVTIYLVAWGILDSIALTFETAPEISVWSPASALDIVLILAFGWKYSFALLLSAFIHNHFITGRNIDWVALLILELMVTLGYGGACAFLLYKLRINPRLRQLRDVTWFLAIAVLIAPLIVALLQAATFAYFEVVPWSKYLINTLHYWAGDATGITMLTPFLLVLLRKFPWIWAISENEAPAREHKILPACRKIPLFLVEGLALSLGIWVAYSSRPGNNLDYTYFVFLPSIWIALKHGFERATGTVLFINVAVAFLVCATFGKSNVVALQFGLMAITLTCLLLGGIASNRQQTEKALRDSAAQLNYSAFYDVLTSLPNRALFSDRLKRAFEHGKQVPNTLYAVLFIDLNQFKVVNDSLGHTFGDRLLIAIARKLETCLRPSDTIARLGGDEFTILLESLTDVSDTIRVAERIQAALALPFELEGQEVFATASIGIALSVTGYLLPDDILRDADIAMYRAKQLKTRYEIFNTAMHIRAVARLQMETELRRAVERQEFLVYYQPLVSLVTGRLSGFEALVRWQHPQHGILAPAKFIVLAEETGLLNPIDQWVMREACRQMQQWQEQIPTNPPLLISTNLGNKLFSQPNLSQQISQILTDTSLDAISLKLEITENVLAENDESTIATLLQIKALGGQLSIDDFGTGYSSLSRLHCFPIDELKIDRSFVSKIGIRSNLEITETILTLAQKLGMSAIAEGIETAEQLARLRELNCP
ncbi:putative bifunctional diguanylate cyclase/phosphodiesterase [Chlorogloea sp. CCALA 695]|uniref:putative bifunctional diguanylate cyclase/phosphodiesterase n=1 Tax=Chlorogloea sp. CCALA 695 TaxID=2107693 RepID=UPI001E37046F|nr:EAL domain-containing protein [Chlorogloea sp. CCALA 695]